VRIRWIVYAWELAALVGAYVLIGFAFGWVIAAILGGGMLVLMAGTWFAAEWLKRRRGV
jgi:hypothetical protein